MPKWIIIFFYILGICGSYRYIQLAHSKEGKWFNQNIDSTEILLIIMPLLNVFMTIGWLVGYYKNDCDILNKIFRIHKE